MKIKQKHHILKFFTKTYWKYGEHPYSVTLTSLVPTQLFCDIQRCLAMILK